MQAQSCLVPKMLSWLVVKTPLAVLSTFGDRCLFLSEPFLNITRVNGQKFMDQFFFLSGALLLFCHVNGLLMHYSFKRTFLMRTFRLKLSQILRTYTKKGYLILHSYFCIKLQKYKKEATDTYVKGI